MRVREALESVYRKTTYVAEAPFGAALRIRIGQRHPDLDAWLDTIVATSWGFVTACNPGSVMQGDEQNIVAMAALEATLKDRHYSFARGYGQGDDDAWLPEPSFLIFGITRAEATVLAEHYGQNAYVYGESGGTAELVWTSDIDRKT